MRGDAAVNGRSAGSGRVVDRRVDLLAMARGRRVLHVGCVDEMLTLARHGTGDLLHQELATVASELTGLDISRDGIALMERLVPGRYIVADAEHLGDVSLPDVDLVVAAEMIEHLGSPHLFLTGLRDVLAESGASAVITTPNAYSWRHFAAVALRRQEQVHQDHRLLYSATTLIRSLEAAGLQVDDLRFHTWLRSRQLRSRLGALIDRAVLRWEPRLAVGLIVECRASPTLP
ncbi:MAG: class I SAM-dependent methyltransferase [Acidimicrobiales bacterium]